MSNRSPRCPQASNNHRIIGRGGNGSQLGLHFAQRDQLTVVGHRQQRLRRRHTELDFVPHPNLCLQQGDFGHRHINEPLAEAGGGAFAEVDQPSGLAENHHRDREQGTDPFAQDSLVVVMGDGPRRAVVLDGPGSLLHQHPTAETRARTDDESVERPSLRADQLGEDGFAIGGHTAEENRELDPLGEPPQARPKSVAVARLHQRRQGLGLHGAHLFGGSGSGVCLP